MFDPIAQQVGIGGALFLSALFLLLKYKPWRNSNGDKLAQKQIADLATSTAEHLRSYWTTEFRKIMDDAINASMSKRNEDIRRIIREELLNALQGRGG